MSLSESTERNNTAKALTQKQAGWRANLQILTVLFKSRVVSLLLLAATGGAFLAAGGWPGLATMILLIVAGGLTASGSAGLNQYLEQGSDSLMGRTRRRPLVTGELQPRWVLWVSALMVLIPPLLIVRFNPALAFFLFAGAFVYVVLYTIVLKPRTLLNIVIGGAAGSMAVMSGGAAAGNWQEPAVVALALLVFLWTPSHFWSLAILYREDYSRADVPMLPVHTTLRQAAWWVFLHTGMAGVVALLLVVTPNLGLAYFLPVLVVTADIVLRNVRLIRDPSPRSARGLFIASNIFLAIVLLAACAGTVLHSIWSLA
ncbi:MAG TPA: heme o synthase [Anaerolineae bacterium]|jgi:protoheme IX farnesyltransferase|nr:heme o synthase [Anaerolineae bacterium]